MAPLSTAARLGGASILAMLACCWAACGSDAPNVGPAIVPTAETCKVDGDCKAEPAGSCLDAHEGFHYEVPTCGKDQLCVWSRVDVHCGVGCHEGYCVSASVR
jgi:hypothetical protein